MLLIVGVGNPGKKYMQTRHNAGFLAVEAIRKKFNFPQFQLKEEFSSFLTKGRIENKKVILAMPQTFMNNSGKAVKEIVKAYKIKIEDSLIILHDDADLLLGRIKIVKNRGSAGHKGIESIISELGSKNFLRIRIGIGKFEKKSSYDLKKFVLQKFTKKERSLLKEIFKKIMEGLEILITQGVDKAMTRVNK